MRIFPRLAVLATLFVITACSDPLAPKIKDATFAPELGIDLSRFERRASGLYIQELVEGTGPDAGGFSTVKAWYTGWLVNGVQFDTRVCLPDDDGECTADPAVFSPSGAVIAGFAEGIRGMRAGGKRLLIIPPSLGYGNRSQGSIPRNSILVFEIEVVSVN
ncbi:MAG: FKBP-type peptidyl-prolyl cis-trans isomerase [Gemmatimonadota bacterium]|jgi:peptidylprolyl isomerase|nr:FKBP-type peptidyl-prolyl cis-trans isomerase [Gemmatimonadota bacterium]